MSDLGQSETWGILTFKLTDEAATVFHRALDRAQAELEYEAEQSRDEARALRYRHDAEWLRWGMGRIDEARRRS